MWREHDLKGALGDLPRDFEWLVPGFPGDEATRGPEATLEFFRDWIEQWEGLRVDWEVEQASFREGVPVRMVYYADDEEARRAAGVPSPPYDP